MNTSIGRSPSKPAARISSAMPRRRKVSIVRALQRSIFGSRPCAGRLSTSSHRTPCLPSSIASVSPTGPPPTMITSVSHRVIRVTSPYESSISMR